ncbi:MAG TPA: hypothetical protein VH143_01000 [Kofleriaceae bacterium]|nr:hypothetical protein [Kofleriaceae bacterium]
MRLAVGVIAIAGCASNAAHKGSIAALRPACAPTQLFVAGACKPTDDARAKLAGGMKSLAAQDVDAAKAQLDAVEQAGPLDHQTNVTLWEQRGIAAAYGDDEPGAQRAFDMMLALDPGHFLSYTLSPKATFVFERTRKQAGAPPELEVNWARGQKVGDPVPLDVEVVADPKRFLDRATVFVRARGDHDWRAADLALHGNTDAHLVLPPVVAQTPTSLELYMRAYDARGNEVLAWADPQRPREIALRYEPPAPWYRHWWVYAIAGSALAIATGITVYELTIAPPSTIDGGATVSR